MPITERTLKKWRKESLKAKSSIESFIRVEENWSEPILNRHESIQLYERILRLTLELLDQHLLRK